MLSMLDLMAGSLFAATTGMYFLRLRHEAPTLLPYLLILWACVAGDWLAAHESAALAICILTAGAFLLLHIVSQPYAESSDTGGEQ